MHIALANTDEDGADDELPPDWLATLDLIAGGLYAWAPLPRLAEWVKVPCLAKDAVTIDRLARAGWVELWELDDHDVVATITEWAADRLRIEIIEEGVADRPRWGQRTDEGDDDWRMWVSSPILPGWSKLPVATKVVVSQQFDALPTFPELIDPAPSPEEDAIAAEEADRNHLRETVAMREDEVTTYDEAKGETTVDVVESPVELWGKPIPVAKIKGKRAKTEKVGAKAKGRRG